MFFCTCIIWHVAWSMWHVVYATNHSLFECMGSTEAFLLVQVNIWDYFNAFLGPHNSKKNWEKCFSRKFSFKMFWQNFVNFFKHALIIGFIPYVFVITGKLDSTAFRCLLDFLCHQFKKGFVWKGEQGLIYSSSWFSRAF